MLPNIGLNMLKDERTHLDYTPISRHSLSKSYRAHQFNLFMFHYRGIQVSISYVFNVMFSAIVNYLTRSNELLV